MIHTITNYRPGIYAEIFRRNREREERAQRWLARIDLAADLMLGALAFSWLAFVGWFLASLLFP